MTETRPEPPEPLNAAEYVLDAGKPLYRVFTNTRRVNVFNPKGRPASTRIAFFGDPPVPVLYAANGDEAAVSETLLHDVPLEGGALLPHRYRDKVMGLARPTRDLRLAMFMGTGLRRLGVEQRHLTDTPVSEYQRTTRWAQAAHAAGFDGVVWMSKKCNTAEAYVLFGDRVGEDELIVDDGFARIFMGGEGFNWLVDMCTPLRVEVITELF